MALRRVKFPEKKSETAEDPRKTMRNMVTFLVRTCKPYTETRQGGKMAERTMDALDRADESDPPALAFLLTEEDWEKLRDNSDVPNNGQGWPRNQAGFSMNIEFMSCTDEVINAKRTDES